MTEYGQVIQIKDHMAYVKFMRTSACGSCRACGMLSGQNEIVIQVPNTHSAAEGDCVEVQIETRKALMATVLAYVFPLFMLVLGMFVGWLLSGVWHLFADADTTMALCAIIFALLSFLLLKIGAPIYNKMVKNVYTMVSKK